MTGITGTATVNRWGYLRPLGWGLVALVLLTPWVAMRFTDQVAWTTSDFVLAGVLLIGGGLLIEATLRWVANRWGAVAICASLMLAILLIWADGAVGIF